MMERVLIIEDERAIAAGLERNLRFEGFEVAVAHEGEEGLEQAMNLAPDLILLDVMMPGMNGFEVLAELRRQGLESAVIMLTAKGQEGDKVRGLDLGADDYVTKPFGLPELLSRVHAVLRRKRRFDRKLETAEFGRVRVDTKARRATVNGAPVEMTEREFALLMLFLQRSGEALARQEILNQVWGYDYFGTDRTVDNFVNRLRKKFEEDPEAPRHFLTVRGVGYRFEAKIDSGDKTETEP